MKPQRVNKPHVPKLRQVKSWQAHICGEGEGEELLIGIVYFDHKDKPIAETHMTLGGACDMIETMNEVIAAYREQSGATEH